MSTADPNRSALQDAINAIERVSPNEDLGIATGMGLPEVFLRIRERFVEEIRSLTGLSDEVHDTPTDPDLPINRQMTSHATGCTPDECVPICPRRREPVASGGGTR